MFILHRSYIHILAYQNHTNEIQEKIFSSHFVDLQYAYIISLDSIPVSTRHPNKTAISHLFQETLIWKRPG